MSEDQQLKPKPKLKKKTKVAAESPLDLGDTFDPASSKDKDFDLDLDAAHFQGKKGQAGSRTKSGDDPDGWAILTGGSSSSGESG